MLKSQLIDLSVGMQSQVMEVVAWLCFFFHFNLQTILPHLNQLYRDWLWSSQLSVNSDTGSDDVSSVVRGTCSLSGRHICRVAVFFSSWSYLHTIFRHAILIIDGSTHSILSAFYYTNWCSFLLFSPFDTK